MTALIKKLWNDEAGQGLPEHALLVGAVVVMVVTAATLFTGQISAVFTSIGNYITGNSPTG